MEPSVMPVRISPASAQDTIRITALIRSAFGVVARRFDLNPINCPKHPSNCTEHWVARDIARGVRYYLAAVGKQVVGSMAVEHASASECYLERLAVHPEAQCQGVGAALVKHGLAEAQRLEVEKVGVAIIAEQSELSNWYQNLGFTPTATRRFLHLPFEVAFLSYRIMDQGHIGK
jgi:predicted N-acetyltransferase YhbS